MAAAIIPLVTAAAPLVIPLIKDLVKNMQDLWGHNNGTGQTKAESVTDAVLAITTKLSAAGKIPGIISPETVVGWVELVVQQMKADGKLPSEGATPAPIQPSILQSGTAGSLTGLPVTITGVMAIGGK